MLDDTWAMTYRDLLGRLADFGVEEIHDEVAMQIRDELGCRTLKKVAAFTGTPYVTLRVEDDGATIYWAEIRNVLRRLGIAESDFLRDNVKRAAEGR